MIPNDLQSASSIPSTALPPERSFRFEPNLHQLLGYICARFTLVSQGIREADLEIIKACAKQTQEFEIAQWAAMDKKSEANVRAAGTVVVELTPAQMQLFQDAMKPLYAEFGAKYQNIINGIAEVGKKF